MTDTPTPTLTPGALALLRAACAREPGYATVTYDGMAASELAARAFANVCELPGEKKRCWAVRARSDGRAYLAALDAAPAPTPAPKSPPPWGPHIPPRYVPADSPDSDDAAPAADGDGERRCEPMTLRPGWVEYLSWLANKDDAGLTDYGRAEAMLARNLLTWGDKIDGPNAHPPAAAPAPKTGDASLDALVDRATTAFNALPPERQAEHRRQQREGYVRAELAMGSDADERAYREQLRKRQEDDRAEIDALMGTGPSTDERLGRLERAVGALVEGNDQITAALENLIGGSRDDDTLGRDKRLAMMGRQQHGLAAANATARAALAGEEG